MRHYLIVNFGGPRDLSEVASFLTALLQDKDVIRTSLPTFLHNPLFRRIALKRAKKIQVDYEKIGGKSPIYEDTESLAAILSSRLQAPVLTFHRYLPKTHKESLEKIRTCPADELVVLPLFPQFSYATTGSIARFFTTHLPREIINKMLWIKSYATHPGFVRSYQQRIFDFLAEKQLKEEKTILLFSAHGIPQSFMKTGEIYPFECVSSFKEVLKPFSTALGRLSFQSKFGKGEWLRPYTEDVCQDILSWHEKRENVVFVPIAFTSDHIETLFEIEEQYLPLIEENGLKAFRCPALNLEPYWIDGLEQILRDSSFCITPMLIR